MGLTGIINEMPAKVRKLWKTEYNDKLLKIISFRSSVMKKLDALELDSRTKFDNHIGKNSKLQVRLIQIL